MEKQRKGKSSNGRKTEWRKMIKDCHDLEDDLMSVRVRLVRTGG
jgi:hypothetical protein